MYVLGLFNHRDGVREDEIDCAELPSPPITAFHGSTNSFVSIEENEAASLFDDEAEAVAAEYLRVMGDRVQAEYGNRLNAVINGLNWTLARDVLIVEVRRVLVDLVAHISDIWTQV